MLGRRKMVIDRLRKQNDALKAEKEALNEILDTSNEECRKLQLQIWNLEEKLAQERKNSKRQEHKIRSELWKQVHVIFINKESVKKSMDENHCGCFFDQDSGIWEVILDEDAGRVAFRSLEDARCYYKLYQVFRIHPKARASMEGYLERFRKSA